MHTPIIVCIIFAYGCCHCFQVRIDHMAVALSKTFKSPVVDTIQCLPQHQQVTLLQVLYSVVLLQYCIAGVLNSFTGFKPSIEHIGKL